jgi:hypothetical protein
MKITSDLLPAKEINLSFLDHQVHGQAGPARALSQKNIKIDIYCTGLL